MDVVKDWIPEAKGFLPYYMLTLSIIAVGNSIQNYMTLHFTRRVYDGRFVPNPSLAPKTSTYNPEDDVNKLVPASSVKHATAATDQMTPLAARLFGTYTLAISVARIYACYHLEKAPMYDLGIWTYVIALGHFASEYFYFRSMGFGLPQFFPFTFATIGIVWMLSARSFYVEA